ncbi:VOC family protein [Acetobacter fallax]|uniref:VOC family protein n=1 Tax=Acetobacter fallax TaxID=1737473 RepID=A0ABX0K6I0_9PROT|nr:VOC family protein [Acetobacter fallax]NHO31064.1 VOC family protein [Acetobacter fallax]NHO34621.1 VOC family protein [Acetobacter fallax]
MFSHIMLGSNDIERSKKFYDAIFESISIPPSEVNAKGRLVYAHHKERLVIGKPINGKLATPANGGTIGFAVDSAEHVEAWHRAGVANGGEAVEDPPGIRKTATGDLYLAYLRDPDGNKLCAMYPMPVG